MGINAGKMNTKITIEKRSIEIIKGVKKETWNEYYSCWSELLDLYGQEKYNAFNVKLENSIKFRTRYCNLLDKLIGNIKEYRVIWKNEIYDLIFIDSKSLNKKEIILQVKRVS